MENEKSDEKPGKIAYERVLSLQSCRLPGFNITKNGTSPHVRFKDFVYCSEHLFQRIMAAPAICFLKL